ncbi:LuxR family transcriptional regulator [uncultured Sphingomonas sp.]|uniref:LuxR family transcriptional regulator n=1 Tax=uncultured Sphingomonas sp. TaxID=158754 RepID=UPI00260C3F63|nr:LuxR family transcriptional regulator [uncultured Sphingomonas sp.]
MRIEFAETLGRRIQSAISADDLHEALARSARDMGFNHFALSLEIGCGGETGASILLHDYPASWADVYVGSNLGATDPIRRAAERSLLGFRWDRVSTLIPVSDEEQAMFETGRRHGIADGYTIPRHLPGEVTASCSFVICPGGSLPEQMLLVAELIGAMAIASARYIAGWVPPASRPKLTDRQRDCVLWAARGKTDWEISRILGISHDTVITHLKEARERYDARKRASLILRALFDGLISFGDIFRWRETL